MTAGSPYHCVASSMLRALPASVRDLGIFLAGAFGTARITASQSDSCLHCSSLPVHIDKNGEGKPTPSIIPLSLRHVAAFLFYLVGAFGDALAYVKFSDGLSCALIVIIITTLWKDKADTYVFANWILSPSCCTQDPVCSCLFNFFSCSELVTWTHLVQWILNMQAQ